MSIGIAVSLYALNSFVAAFSQIRSRIGAAVTFWATSLVMYALLVIVWQIPVVVRLDQMAEQINSAGVFPLVQSASDVESVLSADGTGLYLKYDAAATEDLLDVIPSFATVVIDIRQVSDLDIMLLPSVNLLYYNIFSNWDAALIQIISQCLYLRKICLILRFLEIFQATRTSSF